MALSRRLRARRDVINGQGLRSTREYAPKAPPGILRVAVFGDSFVYGNEVSAADVWTTRLEGDRSEREVLNYGGGRATAPIRAFCDFVRRA